MDVGNAQDLAYDAAREEIKKIEELIEEEAKTGKMCLSLTKVSMAALSYFRSKGFEVMTIGFVDYAVITW